MKEVYFAVTVCAKGPRK